MAEAAHAHPPAPKVSSDLLLEVLGEEVAARAGAQLRHKVEVHMVGLFASEERGLLEVLVLQLADGAGEVVLAGVVPLWLPCDADEVSSDSFGDECEVPA